VGESCGHSSIARASRAGRDAGQGRAENRRNPGAAAPYQEAMALAATLGALLGVDTTAVAAPVVVPDPEGARLAVAAAGGSADAFQKIVERHQDQVYRLVLRMVRDTGIAEDIAQETFLKAYRALGHYDPQWKLGSWLLKIAHNATIDHLRRQRLDLRPLETESADGESRSLLDVLEDENQPSPEALARGRALLRDLGAAVDALDPGYRELVLMRFSEGLAYQDIAAITGQPLGTVKVRLHRARKRLAEAIAARGWR
jgi:RNA polymerase sigma-70 factor (ECF subfamily)